MYKKWAADTMHYSQVLAAIFGQMECEECPTVDSKANLTSTANPWATQMHNDFVELAELDEKAAELMQIAGNRVVLLFRQVQLREGMKLVNETILRAKANSVCIPPPGFAVEEASIDEIPTAEKPYVCDLCEEETAFVTKKALLKHANKVHNVHNMAYRLTLTNQCAMCMSTFATTQIAAAHLHNSMRTKNCTVDASAIHCSADPHWPQHKKFECPECHTIAESLPDLQRHIRNHLPEIDTLTFGLEADPEWEAALARAEQYKREEAAHQQSLLSHGTSPCLDASEAKGRRRRGRRQSSVQGSSTGEGRAGEAQEGIGAEGCIGDPELVAQDAAAEHSTSSRYVRMHFPELACSRDTPSGLGSAGGGQGVCKGDEEEEADQGRWQGGRARGDCTTTGAEMDGFRGGTSRGRGCEDAEGGSQGDSTLR